MNKILIILIASVMLASCQLTNDLGLDAENISSIDVVKFELVQTQTRSIIDRQKIIQIVDCLNHAKKELNKFHPSYKLIIHSKTEEISATIKGSSIHMSTGKRYIADCDIEQLIH